MMVRKRGLAWTVCGATGAHVLLNVMMRSRVAKDVESTYVGINLANASTATGDPGDLAWTATFVLMVGFGATHQHQGAKTREIRHFWAVASTHAGFNGRCVLVGSGPSLGDLAKTQTSVSMAPSKIANVVPTGPVG